VRSKSALYYPLFGVVISLLLLTIVACDIVRADLTATSQISSIKGRVVDVRGNGVGDAKVTLYNVTHGKDGKDLDTSLTTIDHNPQYTGWGSDSAAGYYKFFGVPTGRYDIVIDIDNTRRTQKINLSGGDLSLQDIVVGSDIALTATAELSSTVIPHPTTTTMMDPSSGIRATAVPPRPEQPRNNSQGGLPIIKVIAAILVILQLFTAFIIMRIYSTRRK